MTFAENDTYLARAEQSAASAILVAGESESAVKVLVCVPNARIAFAKVLPLFFPEPTYAPGIHPSALIAPTAQVDGSAHIGPYCVVEEGVRVGARSVLAAMIHVGAGVHIGEDTRFYPRVTIYPRSRIGNRVTIHAGAVIGSDGYGYVLDQGTHRKIPQVGDVVIQDDVEIGANVTIDRGALGSTVIGKGTKIDNLVQVAHNVQIGQHSILVAQVGIGGSTTIGDGVTLAGQVGIADHVEIESGTIVGAQAGVPGKLKKGVYLGSPAKPYRETLRSLELFHRLPELHKRLMEMERKLAALTKNE